MSKIRKNATITMDGCDNCGNKVKTYNSKRYFPMLQQWIKVFLCVDCIEQL